VELSADLAVERVMRAGAWFPAAAASVPASVPT
jgi:hypothetical protein